MPASISTSIIACLKSFNEFIEDIKHPGDLAVGAWEDELGRLRMWAANIGAHQTGQSSLDFRLRDASHVREQIIKLLHRLLQRLQDARDVLAEDEESDNNDDGVADADEVMGEDNPKTEIQELQESLATIINCLFQMSMLVRKPALHDVHLGSNSADVAAFGPFDYNHVRDKYPRADDTLVKRLSNAITRRRKYLRYRERHAIKLRQGIENVDARARDFHEVPEGETVKESIPSILSDTVATAFHNQNIEFDDNASDTGISQTSYAPTLLSGGNITIPPPPKSSVGGVPFECPFCFYLITVNETRSWNKHIFQDLQPYICVASTCATPDKLYTTRHEWEHHSTVAHPLSTTDHSAHKESEDFAVCPLCREKVESGKQYNRHLARHLQELALFILPGSDQDLDVTGDQDAESISSVESVDLATLDDRSKLADGLSASPTGRPPAIEDLTSSSSKQELGEEDEQKLQIRLTERLRVSGPEHPDTLTSKANLASLYSKRGWHEEAMKLRQQVKVTRERTLGPAHPDTLTSMANLAFSYSKCGWHEKAMEMREQVMETRERTLGSEHPDTLTSMANLASSYLRCGLDEKAMKLQKQVVSKRERVLGPEHPETLNSMTKLASMYRANSLVMLEERLYERVLIGKEKTFGPDHPSTLSTVYSLGGIYKKNGMLAEAEAMYEWILNAEEKKWSPDGKLILNMVTILGKLYKDHGKLTEAEEMYQRALDGYEKALGRHHASTIGAVNDLSSVYRKQGRLAEAEKILQWALK